MTTHANRSKQLCRQHGRHPCRVARLAVLRRGGGGVTQGQGRVRPVLAALQDDGESLWPVSSRHGDDHSAGGQELIGERLSENSLLQHRASCDHRQEFTGE